MNFKKITDLRKSLLEQEEELRKLRKQFNLIFQNISDGVAVQDQNGVIFANQTAALLNGFSDPKQIMNRPLNKSLKNYTYLNKKGKRLNWKNLPIEKALKGKIDAGGIYKAINEKTGEIHWLDIKSMPILDRQGKVARIITISRDITSHVLADETRNEFLRMTTHELKTPITSIKAYSQILGKMNKNLKNEQMKKYFSKMDNQITCLLGLIENLLDLAKLRQGKLTFYDKWFNLDSAVKENVKNLQKSCSQHSLIIRGVTKRKFFGDKDRISQILANMINNAVKYSPKARRVIIILSTKGGIIKIGVKDFGLGISPRHYKKIFEQFYRVYGQKNKLFPGIGVGLFMSKEIAERYGAKMWVESREGKGSTFFLSLPDNKAKRI
ncbi:MAG: hypothetical protein A2W22_05300 [Candidatus Levybacteria bacterium RBG_16_35_11]|nr:MAG: hypothetical protein A2W22_05300 [Candidatus Levybacteria bacterium RBG_16_35_11]